jgi:hypothetical protein
MYGYRGSRAIRTVWNKPNAEWIKAFVCWRLLMSLINEVVSPVLAPVTFYYSIILASAFNYLFIRINGKTTLRVSLLMLSISSQLIMYVGLAIVSKIHRLGGLSLQRRRVLTLNRRDKEPQRVLRSCKVQGIGLGSFYTIKYNSIILMAGSIIKYTAKLLFAFPDPVGI